MLGLEPVGRRGGLAQAPALLGLGRHAKALFAPDPLHPLAVEREAFAQQVAVGAAVAPAGPIFGELAKAGTQRLVLWGHLGTVALRGAVLAGDPARPTLGEAEAVLQHADRSAPPGRAQKFPLAISL